MGWAEAPLAAHDEPVAGGGGEGDALAALVGGGVWHDVEPVMAEE